MELLKEVEWHMGCPGNFYFNGYCYVYEVYFAILVNSCLSGMFWTEWVDGFAPAGGWGSEGSG